MKCVFVSAGAASFTAPPPLCGVPSFSAVLRFLGHRTQPGAQINQFTIYIPGRRSPKRQSHALLLGHTCERTSRLGRIVASLEVGQIVLDYLHIVGMCCNPVLSDAD